MPSQSDYFNSMVSQLRLLDPAFGVQAGTPEALILETVSAALATATVSLNTLSSTLDVQSKTGDNLDRFLALFGFARQTSTQATGFVTFSTNSPPANDIVIPANTQVYATLTSPANTTGSATSIVYFNTQFQGTIPANSSPATVIVPIIAQVGGSSGNVAAATITSFGTSPVYGITAVTNATATNGGTDAETDAELQTRFQNTVFRNLAGTEDQYLGLIASTQYSTQAQVIGPVSRYQEYIQVPPVDDTQAYVVATTSSGNISVGGNSTTSGNYTTALSTVPNSQYIYTNLPDFVTNGQQGVGTTFYRQGIDWILNTTPAAKNQGDAYRFYTANLPGAENPLSTGAPTVFQPSVTFINVNTNTIDTGIDSIQPEQVVLLEHAYLSTASRNNPAANVYNAVDIYVDGQNPVTASTNLAISLLPPTFNSTVGSYLLNTNYQRYGEPENQPVVGNWLFPLYSEPVIGLPSQIVVNGLTTTSGTQTTTFYELGTQYWLVQDLTSIYGTVRCRNGIEFNPYINGDAVTVGDGQGIPLNQYQTGTNFSVSAYTYDKNIVDLQAMIESSKQITTDVLVHEAFPRYFKLDITVVYSPGSSASTVNGSIQTAVQNYFATQTFGALIQTGSILQIIFSVPGVQNVRYSADLPFGPTTNVNRITETDVNGNPLTPGYYLWSGTPVYDPVFFNEDFFIGDDQLAYPAPEPYWGTSAQYVDPVTGQPDTLPGLIIRARSESTWVRGPYSPNYSTNLPYD